MYEVPSSKPPPPPNPLFGPPQRFRGLINLVVMVVWVWRGIADSEPGFALLALLWGLVALPDLLPVAQTRLAGRIRVTTIVVVIVVAFGGIIWIGLRMQ